MPLRAPARAVVELRHPDRGRWFRLASAVAIEGLSLADVVPEDLDGPLAVAFHLPGDREPIRCHGKADFEVVGSGEEERSERRAVKFLDLDESGRDRIQNYLNERLDPFA